MKYNGESFKPEQNSKENEKLCGTFSLYVSKYKLYGFLFIQ